VQQAKKKSSLDVLGVEFPKPQLLDSALMKNPVSLLRVVSLAEGVSYLVLLGIAMPLKYGANMPWAVKIAGSIHGALFVLFCVALLRALLEARWSLTRALLVFVASLVPFMPFWLDRRMRVWEADAARPRA
jgi:integral membrane protein